MRANSNIFEGVDQQDNTLNREVSSKSQDALTFSLSSSKINEEDTSPLCEPDQAGERRRRGRHQTCVDLGAIGLDDKGEDDGRLDCSSSGLTDPSFLMIPESEEKTEDNDDESEENEGGRPLGRLAGLIGRAGEAESEEDQQIREREGRFEVSEGLLSRVKQMREKRDRGELSDHRERRRNVEMFRVDGSDDINVIAQSQNSSAADVDMFSSESQEQTSQVEKPNDDGTDTWQQGAGEILTKLAGQRNNLMILAIFSVALIIISLRFVSTFNLYNKDGLIELIFCVMFIAIVIGISIKLAEAIQLYAADQAMKATQTQKKGNKKTQNTGRVDGVNKSEEQLEKSSIEN